MDTLIMWCKKCIFCVMERFQCEFKCDCKNDWNQEVEFSRYSDTYAYIAHFWRVSDPYPWFSGKCAQKTKGQWPLPLIFRKISGKSSEIKKGQNLWEFKLIFCFMFIKFMFVSNWLRRQQLMIDHWVILPSTWSANASKKSNNFSKKWQIFWKISRKLPFLRKGCNFYP